jgi:hypothetical protein
MIFDDWRETSQRKCLAQVAKPTVCVKHCLERQQNHCTCIHKIQLWFALYNIDDGAEETFVSWLTSGVHAGAIDPIHFSISAAKIKYTTKGTKFPNTTA